MTLLIDRSKHRVSVCEYYLQERHRGLSDDDYETIRVAVTEWARHQDVDYEMEKSENGFKVTFQLSMENTKPTCMSLHRCLSETALPKLEQSGLWMIHHDD